MVITMNKYLEKLADVVEPDGKGNHKIYPKGHEFDVRADKAKLIKKPMNKYLKGALVGSAVAKVGTTAAGLYLLHKHNESKKKAEHEKAAKSYQNSSGEPGPEINANSKTEALQTAAAVGMGMASAKAAEKLAPRLTRGVLSNRIGRLGTIGSLTALAGTTLAGDYATVKANNAISARSQKHADKL